MSVSNSPLGLCPWCAGHATQSDLIAVMSDDGSCFEAEACLTCGRSWWNNPPKHCAPPGAETITCSELDARRAALPASRGARA
jgi:hypothetical protein